MIKVNLYILAKLVHSATTEIYKLSIGVYGIRESNPI